MARTRSVKSFVSSDKYFFFSTKYLAFIFFKFFSNITFCTYKSLFSYPFRRHLVLMGISYFNIVSENIIKTYLQ